MTDKSDSFASMPSVDDFEERRLLAELESTMFGTGDPVQLGRYEIGRRLGAGAMGVVYEAEDPHLRRQVALKVLHPELRAVQASRGHQRLRREARSLSQVSHPNVIEVYDVGEAEGRVYIAMELVDGSSLDKWLAERPRSWDEVVAVFADAGQGLIAAHEAGVVHRDFKPSNVSIDRTGRVRVLDFGLAKTEVGGPSTVDGKAGGNDHATRDDALVGTPRYMAPEQLAGAAATERSDQYAFCTALFEAVFGRVPFDETRMVESKRTADRMTPPKGSPVPRRIVRALLRGLRPRVDERWPSMDTLLSKLATGPRRVLPTAVASLGIVAAAGVIWTGSLVRAPRTDAAVPTKAENPEWVDALARTNTLLGEKQYEDAEATARKVYDVARVAGDHATSTRAAHSLGRALLAQGRIDEGLEVLELGHADAIVARDDDQRAAIAATIGHTVIESGGLAAAERWLRDARSMAGQSAVTDDTHLKMLDLEIEAALHAGERERGLELATEAVELARRIQSPDLLEASYNRTVMLFQTQNFAEARTAALKLVEDCEALEGARSKSLADALMVLGGIEATLARISDPELGEQALEHSARSVEVYRTTPNVPASTVSRGELNYGNVLGYAGQFERSNELYEAAVARLDKEPSVAERNKQLLADLVSGMGHNFVRLEEFEAAEEHLHRSLLLYEELLGRDHPSLLASLVSLARAWTQQGKHALAKEAIERALGIPGISDIERGPALWEAGEVAFASGDTPEALAYFERCATAHTSSGDDDGAESARARARELSRQ